MSSHREALALAADHLATSRRSVVRVINLHVARALARGHTPWLRDTIETGMHDLIDRPVGDPDVEIVWTAHCDQTGGQPPRQITRLTWCPGEPLPDHTLFLSCTASAPLQA